ncbi:MAG: inositol monophosphatase [Nitrososphaeria archaeon]
MAQGEVLETIRLALNRARQTLLKNRGSIRVVGRNRFGDTTFNIDVESEMVIIDEFKKSGRGYTIISEESGITEVNRGGMVAVVDPLDGSNNGIRGLPCYCVSIAVANGNKLSDVFASGIMNVVTGDIILATQDSVLYNNEYRQRSKVSELNHSIVSIIPRLYNTDDPKYTESLLKLLKMIRHPRFIGSAAIESAYVSVGLLDAFIELYPRLRVVDLAASLHMARISGAYFKLLNIDKDLNLDYDGRISCIVAANDRLGKAIFQTIRE